MLAFNCILGFEPNTIALHNLINNINSYIRKQTVRCLARTLYVVQASITQTSLSKASSVKVPRLLSWSDTSKAAVDTAIF